MSTSSGNQSESGSIAVVLALITLIGILGGALFSNWEKIFPRAASGISASPPTGAASVPPVVSSASNASAGVMIRVAESCGPAVRAYESLSDKTIVGLKCSEKGTGLSGPDYVTELAIGEFVDHAIRNAKLIDSYLEKVNGTTEIEGAANYHNMLSVVQFAEFLGLNLGNLRSYAGTNPEILRAIEHGEKLEKYRLQLSRF